MFLIYKICQKYLIFNNGDKPLHYTIVWENNFKTVCLDEDKAMGDIEYKLSGLKDWHFAWNGEFKVIYHAKDIKAQEPKFRSVNYFVFWDLLHSLIQNTCRLLWV